MRAVTFCMITLSAVFSVKAANLTLLQEYSGASFFDNWQFYGDTTSGINGPWDGVNPWDDTTSGDVFYMGKGNGTNLYHVDPTTGHAFIKVDNTTVVPQGQKRQSISMATYDFFNFGTIWVFDVYHLPWGCSVWPSIWTKGAQWPNDGEIDIVEGQNRVTANQMALHSTSGCSAATGTDQTGTPGPTDCSQTGSNGAGCTVTETQPNSYGQGFNTNGGGVWAVQFDVSGIFIWFWNRTAVPASITTATDSIDISTWPAPSAAYPSSTCDIGKFFGPQQLVIDITLCGAWAGLPQVYNTTCNNTPDGPDPNRCYDANVIGNGTADYAMAYFELGAIRAFSVNPAIGASTSLPPGATTSVGGTSSGGPGSGTGAPTSLSSAAPLPTPSGAGSGAGTAGGSSSNGSAAAGPNLLVFLVSLLCLLSRVLS